MTGDAPCLDAKAWLEHEAHAWNEVTGLGEQTIRWCPGFPVEKEDT